MRNNSQEQAEERLNKAIEETRRKINEDNADEKLANALKLGAAKDFMKKIAKPAAIAAGIGAVVGIVAFVIIKRK